MPVQEAGEKPSLLSEDFLRKIEQLELVFRKAAAGRMRGERSSRKRGFGTDFADYRDYVHGDDPRFIDWNVYGRLEKLFLKLFIEEEDLHLHVLLDSSASMAAGEPPKWNFAARLAAAIAYVGLSGQNRVTVTPLSAASPAPLGPVRGKRSALRLFSRMQEIEPGGGTSLAASARTWAVEAPRRGVAVLISDLLDPGDGKTLGFESALPFFTGKALDFHVVHVLARSELDPGFRGDLRLIDAETGEYTEITMGEPILRKYKANLRGFTETARGLCVSRGIAYMQAASDDRFDRVVLEALRRGGLLR